MLLDGDTLVLAGVTDRSAPAIGYPGPDLDGALAGAPTDAPIVLLDHQPANAPRAAARGVSLQLSGHTHGGMIIGLDRLVARGNNGFVSGAYQVGGMTLYVSNGTGLWAGFALRLAQNLAVELGGVLTISADRLTLQLPAADVVQAERAADDQR